MIGLGKLKVESGKWKVFCANVFSILGSWREFKCGEESFDLSETFMRGTAQALEVPAFAGMTLVAASPFYRKAFCGASALFSSQF